MAIFTCATEFPVHAPRFLVDRGHTIVVIEHIMEMIIEAACIIELDPEGGGRIVAARWPKERLRKTAKSHSASYLKRYPATPSRRSPIPRQWLHGVFGKYLIFAKYRIITLT